ncbi:ATP-binding protein [Variovorax sp. dw_308]|uniref:ATP-binding protein n=1 Tax=Variovorax sp. dw_308 TaxID=2721546 RepID=UPI001C47B7FA|nr:ATP-binding protein [Variovorax sp. dw_308]
MIILKLLAKDLEDRYQTARGVEADLRSCLAACEAHRDVDNFTPGHRDVSDSLIVPEKLYRREAEINVLLAAFDRVVRLGGTKPGGMGMGLSVSRSIIDSHRGRLWAEPNDGPGSTFSHVNPVSVP